VGGERATKTFVGTGRGENAKTNKREGGRVRRRGGGERGLKNLWIPWGLADTLFPQERLENVLFFLGGMKLRKKEIKRKQESSQRGGIFKRAEAHSKVLPAFYLRLMSHRLAVAIGQKRKLRQWSGVGKRKNQVKTEKLLISTG